MPEKLASSSRLSTKDYEDFMYKTINAMVDEVGPETCTAFAVTGKIVTTYSYVVDRFVDLFPYSLHRISTHVKHEKEKLNDKRKVIYWRKKPTLSHNDDPDGYKCEMRFAIDGEIPSDKIIENYNQAIRQLVDVHENGSFEYINNTERKHSFKSLTPCIHLSYNQIVNEFLEWIGNNDVYYLKLINNIDFTPIYSQDMKSVEQWEIFFTVGFRM